MSRFSLGQQVRFAAALVVLCVVTVFAMPVASYATTWYVSAGGNIQQAIDAASPGDTVSVGPGDVYQALVLKNGVSLQGAGNDQTILWGNGSPYLISARSVGASTTVSGFFFYNNFGCGLECTAAASPTISACVFASNAAAGIKCSDNAAPTVTGCTLQNNGLNGTWYNIECDRSSPTVVSSFIGWGRVNLANGSSPTLSKDAFVYSQIRCDNSAPIIKDCTIDHSNNGAIGCSNNSSGTISDVLIRGGYSFGIDCSDSSPQVKDCTVTGIDGAPGISVGGSSVPTFTNCTVTSCQNGVSCGGSSAPTFINCTMTNNIYGAGLSSGSTLSSCTISGNTNWGVECIDRITPNITGCTISNNGGDGVSVYFAGPTITNSVISSNGGHGVVCFGHSSFATNVRVMNDTIYGNGGDGVNCDGYRTYVTVTNSVLRSNGGHDLNIEDVYGPSTVSFCDYATFYSRTGEGAAAGTGNISADPAFVATSTANFRLRSGSPCVNVATSTGAPSTDRDGVKRPFGAGYDMGAYEYSNYTLRYLAGANGSIVGTATQLVDFGASGTTVTATPSTLGYHFVIWSDGVATAARRDVNVSGAATVTASFANTCTVTFDGNGGTPASSVATTTYNVALGAKMPANPTRMGYTFGGWNAAAGGSGSAFTSSTPVTSDVTAWAQWNPITYTVTFNGNGGTPTSASATSTYDTALGGKMPVSPSKTGFNFAGWNTAQAGSGSTFTSSTPVTGTITVWAQWSAITYRLRYSAGAHGGVSGDIDQTVGYNGSGTFVIAIPDTGYHFVTWSDGLTDSSRTDTNVLADLDVTASFAINAYTIAVSPSTNGTITPSGEQVVEYGSNKTFTITPDEGYRILDVLKDGASIGASSSVTFADVSADGHTISATFEEIPEAIPPVTTSDVVAYYANVATITVSATDNPGGSGLAHTWISLDASGPVESTMVTTSVLGTHTLSFWSEDLAGNVESSHTASFIVVKPPSTGGTPSTPSTPSLVKHGALFSTFGYIKRHTAGTYPVTLQFYRKQSGRWVLKKTVTAKAANVLTFSGYSKTTSIAYTGSWRVRARHTLSGKYQYSGWRYFTAN